MRSRQAARHRRARRRPKVAVLDLAVTAVTVSVVAAQDLLVALAVELKLTQGEPVSLQAVEVRRRFAAAVAHLPPVATVPTYIICKKDNDIGPETLSFGEEVTNIVVPEEGQIWQGKDIYGNDVHFDKDEVWQVWRVCVRNLPRNITSARLEEIFRIYGVLKGCEQLSDRGIAYVDFYEFTEAFDAVKGMKGKEIDGMQVEVDLISTRQKRKVDRTYEPLTD
ncbi:hypothetical protein QR680_014591 [Steinernema hermaphroditum]|uniref:RRM domain-containing protein n=1 Tax=Steinernema hermaphroditum TaxID=289476 RepID=A0AA39I9F0_9BILA|nr:hypothetical protein QR680_014591 [Steinernema hermaphroditum]